MIWVSGIIGILRMRICFRIWRRASFSKIQQTSSLKLSNFKSENQNHTSRFKWRRRRKFILIGMWRGILFLSGCQLEVETKFFSIYFTKKLQIWMKIFKLKLMSRKMGARIQPLMRISISPTGTISIIFMDLKIFWKIMERWRLQSIRCF